MDDLISRQAAIDALDFEIVHMTEYCDGKNESNPLAQYNKGLEDGKKAIEALPSAQPERKKGIWQEITWGDCSGYDPTLAGYDDPVVGYVCSCCRYGYEKEVMGDTLFNFCPNCGADMRGEQDE